MAERDNPQNQEQELILIAEALLAAGSVAGLAGVIASVLLVPLPLATRVAEIAIVGVPEVTGLGFMRRVQEENLIYRAAYIRAATYRLGGLRRSGEDAGIQGTEATEQHYFALHQAQEAGRTAGGSLVAQAIDQHGQVLGWYAQVRPTSRPNHRLAHHHNFRPALGPPVLTQAYPGVLNHCLCEVGPPISGAQEIH